MENPIKMDDLVVPLFLETPKWPKIHAFTLGVFSPHISGVFFGTLRVHHW